MRISIVTAVFNNVDTIGATLESVRAQSHEDIEHIVIDGGSTDGTLEVLERYRADISLLISEPDRGIYYAMNKGLEQATGDIVGTLNGDDMYARKNNSVLAVKRLRARSFRARMDPRPPNVLCASKRLRALRSVRHALCDPVGL